MKISVQTLIIFIAMITDNISFGQTNETNISDQIAEYKYETKYVSINDSTNIAYVDEGSGDQILLFIHGLATYLPAWYKNIEGLQSKYRCIAIDLPGYGRSTKSNSGAGMSKYADAVLMVIEKLDLKKVVLVGHSMGGQVAVTAVLKKEDAFDKLILLAPAGIETFSSDQSTWLKAVFTPDFVKLATDEQIRKNWELNFYKMPDAVDFMIKDRIAMKQASDFALYGQTIVGGLQSMLDEPIIGQLSTIRQKTLIVYGANDALIPNKNLNPTLDTQKVGELGKSLIPNAELVMIPECGHFISYDKPEEINKLLDEFLTN
ncbi:MAG: alpha/beta hydrolase [Reichenbachiella sp.]|uniref:alpha/beta fold hydrolase n=1 Tax=Reichenbachiella sp. TaxID=2184521 RepID=UPI003264F143